MAATSGRALVFDSEDGDWASMRDVKRSVAACVQKTLRVVDMVSGCLRRKSITVAS